MKAHIRFLDEVTLGIKFERAADGSIAINALFPEFLERPREPHLSIFAAPKPGTPYLTPHFTADAGAFRRTLAEVSPETLLGGFERLERVLLNRNAEGIEAADLNALAAVGWTAHWLDLRVFYRWVRTAAGEFVVDERTIASLMRHLLRHCVPLAVLADATCDHALRFVLLRFDEADVLHARALFYFPDGVWTRSTTGELVMARDPGWYMPSGAAFEGMDGLPIDRFAAICTRVKSHLARFPRATGHEQVAGLKDVQGCLAYVAGLYGSDLLGAVLVARAERLNRRTG